MGFPELVAIVDRAVQANLGSVPVGYRSEFGNFFEAIGMFDAQFVLLDEGNAGVEQRGPAVFLRLEDLPVDPMTDRNPTLTIEGTDYQVVGRKPDGMGGIVLVLHLAD